MSKLLLRLLVLPDDFHVVPHHIQESLAASLCKPDLELCVVWERVEKWLAFALPVVGAKDGLLELFLVSVCIWKVERIAASFVFVFIDEN